MYSEQTIRKYLAAMKDAVDYYSTVVTNTSKHKVSISEGNDKIGHVPNVSIPPVLSCPHCAECMWWCYDIRDCFRWGYDFTSGPAAARAKNWVIFRTSPKRYFEDIARYLAEIHPSHFRWHVGGDTPNEVYRDGMLWIGEKFPETFFWSYTKEYELWNPVDLPKNFVMMYSEWRGLEMDNPHNRPTFKVRFKGEDIPQGCTWKCPGNCDICRAAHRGCVVGESTWVDEH